MSEKKKFRFNILDVIIILVVVACVVGAAIRYSLPTKLGIVFNGQDTAVVTFYVNNMKTEAAKSSFVEGYKYFCKDFNCYLGELYNTENFVYEPHKMYNTNESGTLTVDTIDSRCDVTGYFLVKGTVDEEKGFMLNKTENLSPGEEIEVNSVNRKMQVVIMSIDLVE